MAKHDMSNAANERIKSSYLKRCESRGSDWQHFRAAIAEEGFNPRYKAHHLLARWVAESPEIAQGIVYALAFEHNQQTASLQDLNRALGSLGVFDAAAEWTRED